MNAYANPVHELAAEGVLRKLGFDGEISLSHRVSGEYREYERTCTTVIDAYVRPRMTSYLRRLEEKLHEAGFDGTAIVTRSGGGAMTFAEAEDRPFETIMSGPVAGAEGAGELARLYELGDVITADVGGTSFDTCLVTDGRAQLMYQGEVEGLPVQTPWVDVRSIGAGGGSIAHVDVGGLLKVGPASAGAQPGPACYGRGGELPTVTDAAFFLGMLGERQTRERDRPRPREGPCRARASRSAPRLHRGGSRARDHDDRCRQHGQRDPRDHNRAGPGSAHAEADAVRRRRAALRHPARTGARDPGDRRPAVCRQLLRVGPARRRPDADRGADADHAALGLGDRRGERPAGGDVRGRSSPAPTAATGHGRSPSTCATSGRSTR